MVNCIVLDDDQDIVDVFCDLLEVLDVDVLGTANTGKDAVNLYKKHNPDIVFTDLQMPKYDGFYVVENIKDFDSNSKLVVITGNSNVENSNLLDLLHVPIIHKPFDVHEIKQILTDIFITENESPSTFEIQYKFKNDLTSYSCTVTYAQYRNFKQLPIVEECLVIDTENNVKSYHDEMQRALHSADIDDGSHILKLSKVVDG